MPDASTYNYPVNVMDNNTTYGMAYSLIEPNSRVLEFGCYSGSFLNELRNRKDCEIFGVDINKDALAEANNKDIPVLLANLNQLNISDHIKDKFDVILLLDILEHLEYPPANILSQLDAILAENGKIIVSLPNINHVDVIIKMITEGWEYQENGLLDNTHVHFYSSDEITQLFSKHGYSCTLEEGITVPAGLGNTTNPDKQFLEVFKSLRPHLNKKRHYVFQNTYVFERSTSLEYAAAPSTQVLRSNNVNSSPFAYTVNRLASLIRLMLSNL